MNQRSFVVTIDGPAGSGKSTVAKRIARYLRLPYIDTGAMYRTVAWVALQKLKSLDDTAALVDIANSMGFRLESDAHDFRIFYCYAGSEYKLLGTEIRSPEISMASSYVAQESVLREILVKKQQEIGKMNGGVLEGRDAGTVIFPKAEIKFFLTASAEVRARRRYDELLLRLGVEAPNFEKVLADVKKRDQQDEEREASPMVAAKDAEIIDTSGLDENAVFDKLLDIIKRRGFKPLG